PLPIPGGERLVVLENFDLREGDETQTAVHDFLAWKAELRSVRDVSAFMTDQRNLTAADATPGSVTVARVTPSTFAAARTAPVLGRALVEEDAREGAPAVVV